MILKKENFIVEYDETLNYIPEVVNYLEIKMNDIMNFFELKKLSHQVKIIIYNNLESYKKHIEKFTTYRDYMCADTNDGNINLLSLEEAHKTKNHARMTLNELKSTILHEFVHICQQETEVEHINQEVVWFWEALATNLGNPELFHKIEVIATDEELSKFSSLSRNYLTAFTIGNYILENYSHEQVLEYIRFPRKLTIDSSKILKEVREWSKQ